MAGPKSRQGRWTLDDRRVSTQAARETRDVDSGTSRPFSKRETVYQHQPSNIPGMTYIGVKSTFPVGTAIPPHKHGGAAVTATVVHGRVLNQMICDGETHETIIHGAGDSWYEPPGCHHVRCENAGDEEAVFVANFVIETRKIEEWGVADALVQIDAEEEERRRGK